MALSLPLYQTIGTGSGFQKDGVIIGQVDHLDPSGMSYYSFAHAINYGLKAETIVADDDDVLWTDFTQEFNALQPVEPFLKSDPANPIPKLYLAVRTDIGGGINGFALNVTTAGIGDFEFTAYYNSPEGYIPIPEVVYSENFLKQTGLSTIFFTPPSDWQEDFIGYPTPRERWLTLEITSGSISTQPEITGAWEISQEISPATPPAPSEPFYNPYAPLLPGNGDTLYLTSTYQPYGMEITYQDPLTEGDVSYVYSKFGGTFEPLTVVSDTSNGFTVANAIPWEATDLLSSGISSSAVSDEAIFENGYITCDISETPTNTTNQFGIGLVGESADSYELRATYTGGNAVYEVYVNGVLEFTSDPGLSFDTYLRVLRYNNTIYFKVGGVSLDYKVENIDPAEYFFASVKSYTNATEINNIRLVDWSERLSTPITITFTVSTGFTISTAAEETLNYPAHYYIQFAQPSEFVSFTEEDSPTGVAGYTLGIVSNFPDTLPLENIELWEVKLLTINSPTNVYFPCGSPASFQQMNLKICNPEGMTQEQTFLLVYLITPGENPLFESKSFTFSVPDSGDLSGILSAVLTVPSQVYSFILVQVDGDYEWEIGDPSAFYMAP